MDAGEALGHHRAHAQIHGHQRRVFARRTLPVVGPADDDGAPRGFGALGERLIADGEAELGEFGNVGAVRQYLRAGGHDVVGGDVVAHLEGQGRADLVLQRFAQRHGADVGAAHDFDGLGLFRAGGHEHAAVVGIEVFRHVHLGIFAQFARVGDVAEDGAGGGNFRRGEVDLRVAGAAAALEVAVERAHGDAAGIGGKAHADAGPAGAFQHARAAGEYVRERAAGGEHLQNLP